MTSEFFRRHKAGFLLLFYLSFSFFCLSNRIDPYVIGIKKTIWYLISPEVVMAGQFFNHVDSLRGRIFKMVRAEAENHILRKQNAQLAKGALERDLLQKENDRLRNLLNLKTKIFPVAISAEVIGRDVRDLFYSFIINKGGEQGVVKSAAVVGGTADKPALVGRIVEIDEDTSKVLLITDAVSAVSVEVSPSGDIGLLEGRNRPTILLRYLPRRSQVKIGDEVLTVGLGGVFPPGVPVGKVIRVYTTEDSFFKEAVVIPYLDFGSLLEVLVLKRTQEPALGGSPS